jgi:DNA-binding MltR family transcriptional regulator
LEGWYRIAEAILPKYVPKGPIRSGDEIAFAQEVFGQLNRLIGLAREQHGRILALSIASFAEECLGRLIKAYLRDAKAVNDLLEGFNAPLGTFASRIKISYSLGLLTESQFADLELIRKIRNEFAHTWDEISFEHAKLQGWIENLNPPRFPRNPAQTPEDKFRLVGVGILSELEVLQSELEQKKQRLKPIGIEIVEGKRTRSGILRHRFKRVL